MRISDWSSDVCSSDLAGVLADAGVVAEVLVPGRIAGPGVGTLHLPDDLRGDVHHRDLVRALRRQARPAAAEAIGIAHGIVACLQRQVLVVVVDRDAAAAAQQRTDLIAALQGVDRKSTRLNSSHYCAARMPS